MVVTNQNALSVYMEMSPDKHSFIGYEINGKITACAAYDSFNGVSLNAHIKVTGYANKEFWRFIFEYPFNQLCAYKIIAPILGSNEKAISLCKKMGFIVEAEIKDCHPLGDAVFLTITKKQCKMLTKSSNLDDM